MKIYKVIIENGFSRPMFFVVDSIAEIEKIYRKGHPDGSEITVVEFLGDDVTVSNDVIV